MAKNWKVGEAVEAIRAGNATDIIDVGRRFPLFTVLAAQVNDAGLKILNAMPDYMTARKVESLLKGEAQDPSDEGSDDSEETPTAPAKAEKAAKAVTPEVAAKINEDAFAGKSPKELYTICMELGITVATKQPSEIYLKAIKKHQDAEAKKAAAAAKAPKATAPSSDEWDDDEPAPAKGKAAAKADDDEWDI